MQMKVVPGGIDLIGQALEDETRLVKFTKVVLGNGPDAGDNAEALSNPVMDALITYPLEYSDSFVTIKTEFTNSEREEGFQQTEIGLFAEDPEGGDDILFAYGYTDNPIWIPAVNDYAVEIKESLLVYVGAVENVTAVISQSTYVTQADLDAHLQDYGNPHQVTAEQVGLGNVPNVSTNNQTPTYAVAGTLSALVSGEILGTAFGKIAKAVASLISHIANATVHITASERTSWNNKANGSHTHGAADIISGVLSVRRGGIGQDSINTNAIVTGNGTGPLKHVNTAAGAAYATAANGAMMFGILPVDLGGTGSNSLATAVQNLLSTGGVTVVRHIQRGKFTPESDGDDVNVNISLTGFSNSNKMVCNLLGFTTTGIAEGAECYIELLNHNQLKIVGKTHEANVDFTAISYEVAEFY